MADGDDTKQPTDGTNTTSNVGIAKKVDVTQSQSLTTSTSSISASLADVITAKATSITSVSTSMQIDTPTTAEVVAKPSTNEPTSNYKMSISNDAPSNATQQSNILDPKAYYTQIKSQLLSSSTSTSTRSTTLEIVTNLVQNDVILNPDKISRKKLVADKSQQLDKEDKEKQQDRDKEGNKATSYLLSALLPTILKIIVSPNGKANSMLNTVISTMDSNSNGGSNNIDQGGKGSKKKKESKKRKKDKISKDGDVTNVTGGVKSGVLDGEMTLHPPSSSSTSAALSSGKAAPSSNQTTSTTSANPTSSANLTTASSSANTASSQTNQSTTTATTTIPKIKTPTCYISPNSNVKSINNECRYMLLILLDKLLSLILPTSSSTATAAAATGALGSSSLGSSSSMGGAPSSGSRIGSSSSNGTSGTSSSTKSSSGGISANKREQHINTIRTILIHVIIEDYENNSILANGILLRLLQGIGGKGSSQITGGGGGGLMNRTHLGSAASRTSSSGGIGREDGTLSKMQTCEYQMLINFTIDLYKSLGGSGAKSKTNLSKRFDLLGGDGKGKKKSAKKTTPGGVGGGSSPVKTSPIKTSPIKESETGASGDSTPSSTPPATPVSLRSNQSYKVLSELPTTILHIIQLHPKQLLKNNISSLISVMMDLLKLVPPSSPASSSSSGGSASTPSKKGGSAPKVTTPSLSTPKLPPKLVHSVPQGSTTSVKTTTPSSPSLVPLGDIMSTPDKNEDEEEEEATLVQRKLQHYQTTLVSFIAAQVKALLFMVHLIRTSSSAANSTTPELKRSSTTQITPSDQVLIIDAAFKSYEESLGTFVIQILRSTSSSSFVDISSSSSSMTKQQQQLSNITIQLRREVLINTRYLLLSSTAGGDTSSSSTPTGMNFRRGFYKHADTMLEERTLLGTSRLSGAAGGSNNWEDDHEMMGDEYHSTTSWGATSPFSKTFNGSFTSLQPLGYSILAEYCSRISTKMTIAQMSRAIRIFSRVLHCDLPLITIHEEGGNIQLLPNFISPWADIQVLAVKWLLSLPQIIMYNRDPNPQIGRDILNRILQTCVRKLEVVSSYTPIILDAVEKEMKGRVDRYRQQQQQQQGNGNADENTADFYDTERSSSLLAILLNLQHLVKPIMSGIKAMFYCLSTYSNNRQNELQRSMEAGEEQFIYPISPSADDLGELAYSGGRSAKLMIDERKTLDKFLKVGLGCCRLFTVNVTELERFFNQMDDGVEGLDDIFSSSSSVSSITSASTNNHKKNFIHRRHKDILELYAVSFTSLETHSFRKLMSNTNIHYIVQAMGEHGDSNILHVFSHLLLMTGKAVSIEFATLVMGYLMERGVDEWVQYETKEKKEEDAMEIGSSTSSKTTTLTKHSNNLSMLFNFVFASIVKYPRNEAILLTHLQKLIKGCFQKAMAEVPPTDGESGFDELVWPGPCLNIVRLLFRSIANGKYEA